MKKKTKQDKKISKVMREFKKGKLPIGKSKKKVNVREAAAKNAWYRKRQK